MSNFLKSRVVTTTPARKKVQTYCRWVMVCQRIAARRNSLCSDPSLQVFELLCFCNVHETFPTNNSSGGNERADLCVLSFWTHSIWGLLLAKFNSGSFCFGSWKALSVSLEDREVASDTFIWKLNGHTIFITSLLIYCPWLFILYFVVCKVPVVVVSLTRV